MPTRPVMIVDDASLMRRIVGELVEATGEYHVVASCRDGLAALSRLREAAPDVVVLDLEMPVMDGLTFLRHARVLTAASILVLSSVADLGSARARTARRLGADAVLSKPSGAVSIDLGAATRDPLLATLRRVAPPQEPHVQR